MGARGALKLVPADGLPKKAGTANETMRVAPPKKPLGLPIEVEELWDEIVPILSEAGLISPADGMPLELALRHFATARRASNELLDGEFVIEDKHNRKDRKRNPNAAVMNDNSRQFLIYAKELGLTFVSRARVDRTSKGTNGEGSNPFSIN